MKRHLPFAIIAAVLVIAFGAGALMFRSARTRTSTTTLPSAVPTSSPAAAGSGAIVTIEEFGDYQCPPCGTLHPVLKQLKGEYGNRVRFVFYQFPLTQVHKHALDAAHTAVAAGIQGRFWEMHDLLYETQKVWSEAADLRPISTNFARQLGLDVERFVRDRDGARAEFAVSSDVQRGLSLGVTGTPTLFIDGQEINSEKLTLDDLRKEINQRLNVR